MRNATLPPGQTLTDPMGKEKECTYLFVLHVLLFNFSKKVFTSWWSPSLTPCAPLPPLVKLPHHLPPIDTVHSLSHLSASIGYNLPPAPPKPQLLAS